MRRLYLPLVVAAALLSGCSKVYVPPFVQVYQPDIQQGNVLLSDDVDAIRAGMSRNQVRALLGSPSLEPVFDAQRWNYVFYSKPSKKKAFKHLLVIEFDDDGRVRETRQEGEPLPVDEAELARMLMD
ncbi:MAG: outer membrane protein assembly factor BamE [Halothiobacillaceae bacterium]